MTRKEYGLIMPDRSVKIAYVFSPMSQFKDFCTALIHADMQSRLEEMLSKMSLKPIKIYPDTALCTYPKGVSHVRDATKYETEEYLQIFDEDTEVL